MKFITIILETGTPTACPRRRGNSRATAMAWWEMVSKEGHQSHPEGRGEDSYPRIKRGDAEADRTKKMRKRKETTWWKCIANKHVVDFPDCWSERAHRCVPWPGIARCSDRSMEHSSNSSPSLGNTGEAARALIMKVQQAISIIHHLVGRALVGCLLESC